MNLSQLLFIVIINDDKFTILVLYINDNHNDSVISKCKWIDHPSIYVFINLHFLLQIRTMRPKSQYMYRTHNKQEGT